MLPSFFIDLINALNYGLSFCNFQFNLCRSLPPTYMVLQHLFSQAYLHFFVQVREFHEFQHFALFCFIFFRRLVSALRFNSSTDEMLLLVSNIVSLGRHYNIKASLVRHTLLNKKKTSKIFLPSLY